MDKFEYLFVDDRDRPFDMSIEDWFNSLGNKGWELVSKTYVEYYGRNDYIFKRKIQQGKIEI